jgi:pSer/pThr/pTyr-binding forkhead associated (FHA) protein
MIPRRDSKPLEYAALLPMFGGMEKKPRFIDRDVITMGRARGSDFCLDGNEVSALHCLIYRGSDGYRVRDCGSRTGTRLNGQSVKTALLSNGDVLQIGPFSFEVRIPRSFSAEGQVNPVLVEKLKRSRGRIAESALRLRKKLQESNRSPAAVDKDLVEKAKELKAKIKQYDQRVNQLEMSEQELLQEREDLEKLRQEFQRQVHIKDTEHAELRKKLEAEYQARYEGVQKEMQAQKRGSNPGVKSGEVQKVQVQKQELEALANRLKKKDAELTAEVQELQRERDELEKARTLFHEEQIEAQKQLEAQRQELARRGDSDSSSSLAAAENDLIVKKAELAGMMEEVKHLQEELRKQAVNGETIALQARIQELTRQLQEAQQSHFDENHIRQILADVDVLQQENKKLRESAGATAGDPARLATLEKENRQLHEQLQGGATLQLIANPDTEQELERLREENRNILKLAEELQEKFAVSGTSVGNDAAIAALRSENETLKTKLSQSAPLSSPLGDDDLKAENQVLRRLLDEAEEQLKKMGGGSTDGAQGDGANPFENLKKEYQQLQDLLREKDNTIRDLEEDAAKHAINDPESYEAELNRFRKELEADRTRLNKELEAMKLRNHELDEATREMEMEMSRERAEMARERIRLDRLRDEVKADMEKLQREMEVRGSLGAVQKLREELKGGSANGAKPNPLNDRLRSVRNLS